MKISVCLATYNGEKYIAAQLKSIIEQLDKDDEIIIVDDSSIDNTLNVIKFMNDSRIKIFVNEINRGHVFSFGRAISLATKDIIFTSDQDDVWVENRVSLMCKKILDFNIQLVSSNFNLIDKCGIPIDMTVCGVKSNTSKKYWSNIINIFIGKANYFGCAMAFRSDFRDMILPIPSYVESHDLWIAMAANLMKSNCHCDEVTLRRRIHGANATETNRKLLAKLRSRICFIRSLTELFLRNLSIRK